MHFSDHLGQLEPDRKSFEAEYWTQLRRELVQWLHERAPSSFAQSYVGAVRLLHDPAFEGRIHFICHVVRDIYRRLPRALGAKFKPRPSEVLPGMVDTIAEKCAVAMKQSGFDVRKATAGPGSAVEIPLPIYRAIQALLEKHETLKNTPKVGAQLAVALFRSSTRGASEHIPKWVVDSFDAEYDFFVGRAHLAETFEKVPTDDGLVQHFEAFERAFHSLIGPYFSGKDELDELLRATNAKTD